MATVCAARYILGVGEQRNRKPGSGSILGHRVSEGAQFSSDDGLRDCEGIPAQHVDMVMDQGRPTGNPEGLNNSRLKTMNR
jgi:hypothetical protein